MANKRILKIRAGSHLYGTNTPNSDQDYLGIYLNSKEELLGLQTSEELTEDIVIFNVTNQGSKQLLEYIRKYFKEELDKREKELDKLKEQGNVQ